MATPQTRFVEHLVVHSDRTVQGSVEGGVTVKDGATLVVQGAVAGRVVVADPEALLSVQGALAIQAGYVASSGTILAAGAVAGDPADAVAPDGRFAVAVGTVVAGSGRPYQVLADGSTRTLHPDESGNVTVKAGGIEVDASRYVGYRAGDDTWVPLG